MVKPFLRSGRRSDYLPLGENGQTVFDSALQIREALRLHGLHAVADCLAIPQCHDDNENIDWYAPRTGTLTSWVNISHSHRVQLLNYLQQRHAELEIFRRIHSETENTALRLFTLLLKHILQFPDVQHIWQSNDKPIIEFWGFTPIPLRSGVHMLDVSLREEEELHNQLMQLTAPPDTTDDITEDDSVSEPVCGQPEPLIVNLSQESQVFTDSPAAPEPQKARKKPRFTITRISLVALVIVGITILSLPILYTPSANKNSSAPVHTSEQKTQMVQQEKASQALISDAVKNKLSALIKQAYSASSAGLHNMVATRPPKPEKNVTPLPVSDALSAPAALTDASTTEPVTDENTLVLFPNSVRAGSVKFLNGQWQAAFFNRTSDDNIHPAIRLQVINGKGEIHLSEGKKSCQAPVSAGLLPSGTLSIKSRTRAHCNDGSRQTVPDISCKQGTGSVAICLAKWANNESAQLTFKKMTDK